MSYVPDLNIATALSAQASYADVGAVANLDVSGSLSSDLSHVMNLATSTLNAQVVSVPTGTLLPTITATNVVAGTFTTGDVNVTTVQCNSLTTNTLTCNSVQSQYFTTDTTQTLTFAMQEQDRNYTGQALACSTFKNGQIQAEANYSTVNNTVSTFSDIEIMSPGNNGSNRLYIYGEEVGPTTSLPKIIYWNDTINAFDNKTAFGGVEALMSLTNNANPFPETTLRYEMDGNLTLYRDPNTILWQTTLMVSDIREKNDVVLLENGQEMLQRLRGVYYTYKDDESAERKAGFIAQELEPVVPEAIIRPHADGYLSVRRERVIPILVQALKEMIREHRELVK
jgi:hypothetical protein